MKRLCRKISTMLCVCWKDWFHSAPLNCLLRAVHFYNFWMTELLREEHIKADISPFTYFFYLFFFSHFPKAIQNNPITGFHLRSLTDAILPSLYCYHWNKYCHTEALLLMFWLLFWLPDCVVNRLLEYFVRLSAPRKVLHVFSITVHAIQADLFLFFFSVDHDMSYFSISLMPTLC